VGETRHDPAFEADVQAEFLKATAHFSFQPPPGLEVLHFALVPHSLASLLRIRNEVARDPLLARAGVVAAGTEDNTSRVAVFVDRPENQLPVVSSLLARMFPSYQFDVLFAHGIQEDQEAFCGVYFPCAQDRYNDAPPWKAGNGIARHSGPNTVTLCTEGFGVHLPGYARNFATTASHCGGTVDVPAWYNCLADTLPYSRYKPWASFVPPTYVFCAGLSQSFFPQAIASQFVGPEIAVSPRGGGVGVDLGVIPTAASCMTWANEADPNFWLPSRIWFTGWSNPPVGAQVLTEGSKTREGQGTVWVVNTVLLPSVTTICSADSRRPGYGLGC
jgi:hypothetical protein